MKLLHLIFIICTYYDLGVVKVAFLFCRETDAFLYCCDFSPRAIQLVKVNISNIAWSEYGIKVTTFFIAVLIYITNALWKNESYIKYRHSFVLIVYLENMLKVLTVILDEVPLQYIIDW